MVLLNGKKVGDNKGGYVPFTCDLTDALTDDGEQELVVVAWDPTNMGDQTVGKQALPELRRGFRYNPNSGIWQSVWLEPVPAAAHIRRIKITPVAGQQAIDLDDRRRRRDEAADRPRDCRARRDGNHGRSGAAAASATWSRTTSVGRRRIRLSTI